MSNPKFDKIVLSLGKLREGNFTPDELNDLLSSHKEIFNSLSDKEIVILLDKVNIDIASALVTLSSRYHDLIPIKHNPKWQRYLEIGRNMLSGSVGGQYNTGLEGGTLTNNPDTPLLIELNKYIFTFYSTNTYTKRNPKTKEEEFVSYSQEMGISFAIPADAAEHLMRRIDQFNQKNSKPYGYFVTIFGKNAKDPRMLKAIAVYHSIPKPPIYKDMENQNMPEFGGEEFKLNELELDAKDWKKDFRTLLAVKESKKQYLVEFHMEDLSRKRLTVYKDCLQWLREFYE